MSAAAPLAVVRRRCSPADAPRRGERLPGVPRIDVYSWTTTLPGGDRITSNPFPVGGRHWYIDYYPNGDDISKDYSDSISLHLRIHGIGTDNYRVRAHYKFSLLDLAGNAAYELPALESTFTYAGGQVQQTYGYAYQPHFPERSACGHREFITREELERRREVLLKDDCLAIRGDVDVVQLDRVSVAPKDKITNKHDYSDDSDGELCGESRHWRQRQRQLMDDREFIRRCLSKNRRA